jgi:hypothetical protein
MGFKLFDLIDELRHNAVPVVLDIGMFIPLSGLDCRRRFEMGAASGGQVQW